MPRGGVGGGGGGETVQWAERPEQAGRTKTQNVRYRKVVQRLQGNGKSKVTMLGYTQ